MNRKLLIAAVAASALAVGGTAAAVAEDSDDAPAKAVTASDDTKDLTRAEITAKEALDKALATVKGGTVQSLELDDDGKPAWEADVLGKNDTWHELTIDATTGKIVTDQSDDKDGDDDKADPDDDNDRDDTKAEQDDKGDQADDSGQDDDGSDD